MKYRALTLEEVLSHCKYFKFEETCPFVEDSNNRRAFWEWEWQYCLTDGDAARCEQNILTYNAAGLDGFAPEDFRPVRFRAYLFHRLLKWAQDLTAAAEWFKSWYSRIYLSDLLTQELDLCQETSRRA